MLCLFGVLLRLSADTTDDCFEFERLPDIIKYLIPESKNQL